MHGSDAFKSCAEGALHCTPRRIPLTAHLKEVKRNSQLNLWQEVHEAGAGYMLMPGFEVLASSHDGQGRCRKRTAVVAAEIVEKTAPNSQFATVLRSPSE